MRESRRLILQEFVESGRAEAERQRLLEQVEREPTFLEVVLQHLPAGVLIVAVPSGRVLFYNGHLTEVLGQGRPLGAGAPDDRRDGRFPFGRGLARAVARGDVPQGSEIGFKRGDGTRGVAAVHTAPVRTGTGEIIAQVAVFQDLTERKAAEARIRRLALHDPLTGLPIAGRLEAGAGRRVNVEFVSANPTGPMHVGHVRGAVFGDALAGLLGFAGHEVTREYYINDGGAQVDVLARSAYERYREACGLEPAIAEGLYPGDYLIPVGEALKARYGDSLLDRPEAEWLAEVRGFATEAMMAMIRDGPGAARRGDGPRTSRRSRSTAPARSRRRWRRWRRAACSTRACSSRRRASCRRTGSRASRRSSARPPMATTPTGR